MKKLLVPFIALITLISIDNSNAQSKSELRKQAREVKQAEYLQKLSAAIKEGQFTFTAQTMQGNVGNPVNLTYPNNFLSLYGNSIDIQLPYFSYSAIGSANMLDFIDSPVTYEVSFDGTYYYVTAEIQNAVGGPRNFITENGTYYFHFTIAARSGYTVLTVTPQLSTSATYTGVVNPN